MSSRPVRVPHTTVPMFSLKSIAFAIVVLAMSLMMKPNGFVLYAIAIAVLALGLVMIKPEIVLHLPNGFILYAILGHPPVGRMPALIVNILTKLLFH